MRLVLSRKGFDSAAGGVASPILPDRRLVSLPIPGAGGRVPYGAIARAGGLGPVVEDLTRGRIRADASAHLDPDLDPSALPRAPGWRPAYGQTGATATHLASQGIASGDVFLFYGWFREAARMDGRWRHLKGAPDLHVVFGWLQVGEIVPVARVGREALLRERPWLHDHPHPHFPPDDPRNVIFVASDRLVLPGVGDTGLPGAGEVEGFREALVLTAPGAPTRSLWRVPDWFSPERGAPLTYHADPRRWQAGPDGLILRNVCQGQDFVLDCADRPDAGPWLARLLTAPA
ncbi:hypothetical protein [Salinarimonas soli]|uniref:Nucleotide modification associated domain-containing protein n=1 Tax=Salinarimonas soli TaxID=1638099 RepID=A0A5B2V9J4_9HYPH|nr:hypothetical protein [Salinarimonas soli]KAA2235052.1 hypothetical protein F0L46_22220 [Salinarimonas soli]